MIGDLVGAAARKAGRKIAERAEEAVASAAKPTLWVFSDADIARFITENANTVRNEAEGKRQ